MSNKSDNDNDNDLAAKEVPSILNLLERASEEQPPAKENLDSYTKDVEEPLKPLENGHPLPVAGVSDADKKVACTHGHSPMPCSTNVDVSDNQRDSVEPICESVEAAAPVDTNNEASVANVEVFDNHGDSVELIFESVEAAAPVDMKVEATADNVEVSDNHRDSVEPICETVEAAAPIDMKIEATSDNVKLSNNHGDSVEPICESHEAAIPVDMKVEVPADNVEISDNHGDSVEPISETVEATASTDIIDEVSADKSGGTTELPLQENKADDNNLIASQPESGEPVVLAKAEDDEINESKSGDIRDSLTAVQEERASYGDEPESKMVEPMKIDVQQVDAPTVDNGISSSKHLFLLDENDEGSVSGTEQEQSLFMKELEKFFRERSTEFKPPKFYGEGLNCLKLWRAVTRLGGYDKVTSCKLWRQVGESFRPPKTCTTVSWTFRGFYEKALLDYEREKIRAGELNIPAPSTIEPMGIDNQASGSGRTPRDAAARARQGWHSQRLLGNGEVSDPIIKEKSSISAQKREKQVKSIGSLKRKKQPFEDDAVTTIQPKTSKSQVDVAVIDVGLPADWVKINVQKTKDCFEVYALVPGLLREEVRVQSDPAGRLVISGDPEQQDNPWGVTSFKKVVNLPSRIDPHQTSAVVTLHGQLFVRVPFEQAEQ